MSDMNRLEHNVKRILQRHGWTQADLAAALNVDPGNLSRTIRCRVEPGIGQVERIADALGVDVLELFRPIREKEPQPGL